MVQRVAAAWPALLLDGEDLARGGEIVACVQERQDFQFVGVPLLSVGNIMPTIARKDN
jgi:hypothetical protein